jgi:oligoendopeptidase F
MKNSATELSIGSRWSLADLLPNGSDQLNTHLDQIDTQVKVIEGRRSLLSGLLTQEDFLDLLHAFEQLHELTALVGGYAYLKYAENTQDQTALSLRNRIEQILTAVDNRTIFFSLWFKSLTDDVAADYIALAGDLKYYLETLRRLKKYTLTEAEETIINLKDENGCEALVKIYEIITNAFTFTLEVDGELKKLTRDGLTQYYHHPSPEVRAATYQELYHIFIENRAVLTQIYSSLVRDWHSDGVELRGYASPISVRNQANNIPDAVVETLLEVCRKNTILFQRYFKLKAHLLGMDKLRRYDIYAPIAKSDKKVEFQDATSLVLESFRQFSPQLEVIASQVIHRSHLDTELRPGKRGGAFSYSVGPKHIPWVMVNYSGRFRDITTLAHELGHSVHAILASNHSILTFHAPLPLAETASVFAEMLVTDRLLQEETDHSVKRDMLLTILDDAYATVERQAYICIFEKVAHDRIPAGCSSDELAEAYLQQLGEQFGDALQLSEEFAWEWITIPHIYGSPFYTYAYSFGQLLVLALYQQYLTEGDAFIPRYIRLLSYGGSAEPQAILKESGVDIDSPEFWQGGFNLLQAKLDQLDQIIGGEQ